MHEIEAATEEEVQEGEPGEQRIKQLGSLRANRIKVAGRRLAGQDGHGVAPGAELVGQLVDQSPDAADIRRRVGVGNDEDPQKRPGRRGDTPVRRGCR